MNRTARILAIGAAVLALTACGQKKENKMLVLYYSQTGGTESVAGEFASLLGAPAEAIVAVNPYDGDFNATIGRCMQEREAGVLPEIQPIKADLSQYDVIFLGYPVWFGTYAPPVAKLLEEIDLSGKKVVPFCTFGSGGLDSSTRDLKAKQPGAEILDGYGVRAARLAAAPREIERFLKAGGFIEGEAETLEEFPEPHAVTEEESALFDAAVNGYPMLNAKAVAVASRLHPDGTEYLFTAKDQPREQRADMPPANDLKVYVLVEEGCAPVFTQVIR